MPVPKRRIPIPDTRTPISVFPISPDMIYTLLVRIGSVPYLNARPLVDWFERRPQPGITLSYATPAVLVEQLTTGEIDIAMASTFPTLERDDLHLLPGLGVTVTGPALSVRLLSRVPPARIRTLALDASSRSTNVLGRLILADRYGATPDCRTLPPEQAMLLEETDAAVLIGDIGLAVSGESLIDLDLGGEWAALTGLPFYFAGWVSRDPALLQQTAPIFLEACEHGLARLDGIAEEEAERLHLPRELCYRYLAEIMRYHAGEAETAGLTEFRRRAVRLGLLGAFTI